MNCGILASCEQVFRGFPVMILQRSRIAAMVGERGWL